MNRCPASSPKSPFDRFLRTAVLILALLGIAAFPIGAQESHTGDALRQKAIELFQQNKYEEALPLFEDLTVSRPDDSTLQEFLGGCLFAHSVGLKDPEARRQFRLRARQAFLRAKELGDHSNYLTIELSGIPEDGSESPYSTRAEVDSAMREAEATFSRGDFPGAIAGYQQVLKIDPNNYEAALFIGDVYFKQKDFDNSYPWFAKAVANDPNRETAYRYWGDALYGAGKDADAEEKYVQAIVADPYKQAAWIGLLQWAQRNHVTLTQPNIQSPNSFETNSDGSAKITIDPNATGKKDGSQFWMGYEMSRVLWKNQKFRQQFPNEKEYRHSLEEESDSLGMVADSISEGLKSKEIMQENLSPKLAMLLRLKQEGMLEPYILISRADAGISQDYPAYRLDHRDKLLQYVHEFILPAAK